MARALKVCPCISCPEHPGSCPELVQAGRCTRCATAADRRRGTAAQRGYAGEHVTRFREGVLRKHPHCVCTDQTRTATHHHGPICLAPSTVADHHPRSRRELTAAGLDANDPKYGRGLCAGCHGHHTSKAQPGGWNARS